MDPVVRCERCGSAMRREGAHDKCDRCGWLTHCCEGDIACDYALQSDASQSVRDREG